MKKSEQRFRETCHSIKHTKICIMEVLVEEERKEQEKYSKNLMEGNSSNLKKNVINLHLQEVQERPTHKYKAIHTHTYHS